MAKKKRRAPKAKDSSTTATIEETPTDEQVDSSKSDDVVADDAAAEKFVGQWNRLVSTTNWEKGRIICEWRESLMTSGVAVSEYSDEAWAQLVGGVTSQHVGRLRRVFQRFGEEYDQYEGLFWSHFQAALDWDDAEMWLEGSIRNEWSISQMRGKRWETLGTPPEEQQAELAAEHEVEGSSAPADAIQSSSTVEAGEATSSPKAEQSSETQSQTAKLQAAEITAADSPDAGGEDADDATATKPAQERRVPLNIDVDELPDDLAEAFESFKLAIIAHRREGWQETKPESVVSCLDALRSLALAEES